MTQMNDFTDNVSRVAREAGYAAVGFGVIGFQKAQVRRQRLLKSITESREQLDTMIEKSITESREQLDTLLEGVRQSISDGVRSVDEVVENTFERIDLSLDPLEERLPEQARTVVSKARTQAREARQQIRNLVVSSD